MTKEEIHEAVNEAISPEKMSQEEALEFVEELLGELEIIADALRTDIRARGGVG